MSRSPIIKPTDSELEILQVLWERGPATVREVNDALNTTREVGYTTTLKLLQIMLDKGLVACNKESRSHIYSAQVSEEATQRSMLDKFLQSAFKGSASKLVLQALGTHRTSPEELRKIREMLDKIEGEDS